MASSRTLAVALAALVACTGDSPRTGSSSDSTFHDGKASLEALADALLQRHAARGLREEDLYRAAAQGMLEHLEGGNASHWNALLTPRQTDRLHRERGGDAVGFGILYTHEENVGLKMDGFVSGSPAERGPLRIGDLIVAVDGIRLKGKNLDDALATMDGPIGTSAAFTVLRDGIETTLPMTRGLVAFDDVYAAPLRPGVAYLRIRGFSTQTASRVRTAFGSIERPSALVLDLRSNVGGVFEGVLATASLLLPRGATIARVTSRAAEERPVAAGLAVLDGVAVAVLVDAETAAGAELLAEALRESRGARLFGEKTLGKWNVQSVDVLPNGWAAKYTSSRFESAEGKTFEGVGITPDVIVPRTPEAHFDDSRVIDGEARLLTDPTLRAAVTSIPPR